MNIELLKKEQESRWDEFVKSHPQGRFSQTVAFKKVLEEVYHYQANYVVFEKVDQIIAVLPLFWWRDMFRKTHLVSVPLADYGGPLSGPMNEEEAKGLIEFLRDILLKSKAPFLKISSGLGLQKNLARHFIKKENDRRAILELEQPDVLWQKKLEYSVKKCIKAAQRENLKCLADNSSRAISQDFYPLYLLSMKRLGTPPHPLSYFLGKLKYFGQDMKLFLVQDGSETITALLGFATGRTVQITKIVSDPKYWAKRPNDLAHWEFIKWSSENNYQYFDFGPVRYESQLRYKAKWGAQIFDNYNYFLVSDSNKKIYQKEIPDSLLFKSFSKIWSCFPCWFSKKIGPTIRRSMGR